VAKSAVIVASTIDLSIGSAQNYTSSGLGTPDGALIIINSATSDDTDVDGIGFGIGFWDGTTDVGIAGASEDNQDTMDEQSYLNESGIAIAMPDNTTISAQIANITDGISITLDSTQSGTYRCDVILFGGGVSVACGGEGLGAATVTLSPGFVADVLIMAMHTANATGTADDSNYQLGIAVNGSSSGSLHLWGDIGGLGDQTNVNRNDAALVFFSDVNDYYTVSSWTAGAGTDITLTENGSFFNRRGIWLAIGGVNAAELDLFAVPTSAATDTTLSTAFEPDFMLVVTNNNDAVNQATTTYDGVFTLGYYDGTTERGHGLWNEDNMGFSNCGTRYSTSNFVETYGAQTNSDEKIGGFSSKSSSNWVIDWTTIETNAQDTRGMGLAIQWEAAGEAAFTPKIMTY
jgi:hypothetical protein